MLQNATFLEKKSTGLFHCKTCLYTCSRKSHYDRHLSTTKHQNATKMLQNATYLVPKSTTAKDRNRNINNNQLLPKEVSIKSTEKDDYGLNLPCGTKKYQKSTNTLFVCNCGKKYKQHSSYYRHKRSCLMNEEENTNNNVVEFCKNNQTDFKELILLLVKENKEFQKNFMEMIPHIKGNADHSYNTTNSHNTNNFNIQMFLNDHCKNAMNLTDFIESLPITNETYDHTIENGLTKTITHMITNGLNNMDILERPIHCTDPARKTMYVKDNDVWEKDTDFGKVITGIKQLALKQRTMIGKWQDANNGWDIDDDLQTKMTNLVFHSMDLIEHDEKETNKIIKAIGKNTYLSHMIKDEYK